MKKILIASGIIAGLAFVSNNVHAQTGTIYGTTSRVPNGSIGGMTTSCPKSTKICTENTLNPDGTHTVRIHLYDRMGRATDIITLHTKSGPAASKPDIEAGYVNDVETTDGILFGRED